MPTPERHQLTLGQLAEFDDLLTDSLIDRVGFVAMTRLSARPANMPL